MKKLLIAFALVPAISFAAPTWEKIETGVDNDQGTVMRLSTPLGWIVRAYASNVMGDLSSASLATFPDRAHQWAPTPWEQVSKEDAAFGSKTTYRESVPFGWLVRDVFVSNSFTSTSIVFMPDENHVWSVK